MNKKARAIYWWAAFISIIVGIFVILDRIEITNSSENPIEDVSTATSPPTLPSQEEQPKLKSCDTINIQYIRPVRKFFYAGGVSSIAYGYRTGIGCNVTITQEWYRSPIPNLKSYLEKPYIWNETAENELQNNWASRKVDEKEGNFNYSAKIILETNDTDMANYTSFEIVKIDEVIPYLISDNNIGIDEQINQYTFYNLMYGVNSDDYSQAKHLFEFTKTELKKPKKAEEILDFENKNYTSVEVYEKKKGTSSEYSFFYIMLLRAVGVPAKLGIIEKDENLYYYVEVYIRNIGWVLADVYSDSDFDSCFLNNLTFVSGETYRHLCMGNNTMEIVELSIPSKLRFDASVTAKIRNKMQEDVRFLNFNYSFFNNETEAFNGFKFADDSNLSNNETTSLEIHYFPFEPLVFDYVILRPDYWT